jgi:hypothetical protein
MKALIEASGKAQSTAQPTGWDKPAKREPAQQGTS